MEIWKGINEIKGLEQFVGYEISTEGRVKSYRVTKKEGKILTPMVNNRGYFFVSIGNPKTKSSKTFYIHRLVLKAFVGEEKKGETADHINRIKSDNRIENLRWATKSIQYNNRNYTKEIN